MTNSKLKKKFKKDIESGEIQCPFDNISKDEIKEIILKNFKIFKEIYNEEINYQENNNKILNSIFDKEKNV